MDTRYSLLVVDETRSTQDLARDRVSSGRAAVVVARRQTSGRGRGGSAWQNAPVGVAVSVAFEARWPSARWPLIPLVAGVAARRVVPMDIDLKWPNDLMRGDAKAGGILVEGAEGVVVAGMGLNLYWPDPPSGVGAIFGRPPPDDPGTEIAEAWAVELLDEMDRPPDSWPRSEYVAACVTLGRTVTWEGGGEGEATDIAPDGGLVVRTAEGMLTVSSGTVRHVRPV